MSYLGTTCAAAWCHNRKGLCTISGKNISFFRYPKDVSRAKEWVKFCLRDDLMAMDMRILRDLRVCAGHFRESDYVRKWPVPQLKKTAVPSVFDAVFISESGNNDKSPTLEVDQQLSDVNRLTEAASPHGESFQANEESLDSSSVNETNHGVDTTFSNETEQTWAERERIMKYPFECCRLCLERSDNLTDIIKGTELGLVIREAIKDLLNYEVVKKGNSPWQVCFSCIQRLSSFQEFRDRCIETKSLWDDCSKYIDEKSSAYNTSANALQPEPQSDSRVVNEEPVISLQREPNDQESGKEMFSTPNGGITVASVRSLANEGGPINNTTWAEMDYESISHADDVPTVIRVPCVSDNAEMKGEECESPLNRIHTQIAQVNRDRGPNSMRVEGKENSSSNQVKGIYELDGSKGDDGEPLVLVLKVDGSVVLCTFSEIPPSMRSGVQKYSKMSGNLMKKGPRTKGD